MNRAMVRFPALPDVTALRGRFDELLEDLGAANGGEWAPSGEKSGVVRITPKAKA